MFLGSNLYSCDFCGFEMNWDKKDDFHGEMWGCEKCGRTFCSKCFVDRFGREDYKDMMQDCDLIYCPECWQKVRKEGDY